MSEPNEIKKRQRIGWKNQIWWIILVFLFWYVLVTSSVGAILFGSPDAGGGVIGRLLELSDEMKFAFFYLATITDFIGIIIFCGVTKRNRFILRSFLPSAPCNKISKLLWGLLVGFIMNFGCIVCALLAGDIKLFLDFSMSQIPYFLFALLCVFIQSSAEELWTRGFLYERINVCFPLWLAIAVNGALFGLLHVFNPGASVFSTIEIVVCGLSFSLAKWYTGSIWFPMGIHTAWNFTQNFLFGLPNSGIVSKVSIFGLDAANARGSWIYDVQFGVEGGVPALIADAALGIICLVLAARQGRLGELKERQVTPRKDPEGPQPLIEVQEEQEVQNEVV